MLSFGAVLVKVSLLVKLPVLELCEDSVTTNPLLIFRTDTVLSLDRLVVTDFGDDFLPRDPDPALPLAMTIPPLEFSST